MARRTAHASAALLLTLLLVAPFALGHGEDPDDHGEWEVLEEGTYWTHIDPWSVALAPGESVNRTLAFSGTPLRADWHLLFAGQADGALEMRLTGPDTDSVWIWPAGELHFERLPATGFYDLRIANDGDTPVNATLYYDNTCDCIGKSLPVTPGGVWFNEPADAQETLRYSFAIVPFKSAGGTADPANVTVHVRHLSEAMETVKKTRHDLDFQAGESLQRVAFNVTAAEAGRQLVLLEIDDGESGIAYQVKPRWLDDEPQQRDAPAAGAAAALAALALVGWRTRQR